MADGVTNANQPLIDAGELIEARRAYQASVTELETARGPLGLGWDIPQRSRLNDVTKKALAELESILRRAKPTITPEELRIETQRAITEAIASQNPTQSDAVDGQQERDAVKRVMPELPDAFVDRAVNSTPLLRRLLSGQSMNGASINVDASRYTTAQSVEILRAAQSADSLALFLDAHAGEPLPEAVLREAVAWQRATNGTIFNGASRPYTLDATTARILSEAQDAGVRFNSGFDMELARNGFPAPRLREIQGQYFASLTREGAASALDLTSNDPAANAQRIAAERARLIAELQDNYKFTPERAEAYADRVRDAGEAYGRQNPGKIYTVLPGGEVVNGDASLPEGQRTAEASRVLSQTTTDMIGAEMRGEVTAPVTSERAPVNADAERAPVDAEAARGEGERFAPTEAEQRAVVDDIRTMTGDDARGERSSIEPLSKGPTPELARLQSEYFSLIASKGAADARDLTVHNYTEVAEVRRELVDVLEAKYNFTPSRALDYADRLESLADEYGRANTERYAVGDKDWILESDAEAQRAAQQSSVDMIGEELRNETARAAVVDGEALRTADAAPRTVSIDEPGVRAQLDRIYMEETARAALGESPAETESRRAMDRVRAERDTLRRAAESRALEAGAALNRSENFLRLARESRAEALTELSTTEAEARRLGIDTRPSMEALGDNPGVEDTPRDLRERVAEARRNVAFLDGEIARLNAEIVTQRVALAQEPIRASAEMQRFEAENKAVIDTDQRLKMERSMRILQVENAVDARVTAEIGNVTGLDDYLDERRAQVLGGDAAATAEPTGPRSLTDVATQRRVAEIYVQEMDRLNLLEETPEEKATREAVDDVKARREMLDRGITERLQTLNQRLVALQTERAEVLAGRRPTTTDITAMEAEVRALEAAGSEVPSDLNRRLEDARARDGSLEARLTDLDARISTTTQEMQESNARYQSDRQSLVEEDGRLAERQAALVDERSGRLAELDTSVRARVSAELGNVEGFTQYMDDIKAGGNSPADINPLNRRLSAAEAEAMLERGKAVMARGGSLAELARALDIPESALVNTLERMGGEVVNSPEFRARIEAIVGDAVVAANNGEPRFASTVSADVRRAALAEARFDNATDPRTPIQREVAARASATRGMGQLGDAEARIGAEGEAARARIAAAGADFRVSDTLRRAHGNLFDAVSQEAMAEKTNRPSLDRFKEASARRVAEFRDVLMAETGMDRATAERIAGNVAADGRRYGSSVEGRRTDLVARRAQNLDLIVESQIRPAYGEAQLRLEAERVRAASAAPAPVDVASAPTNPAGLLEDGIRANDGSIIEYDAEKIRVALDQEIAEQRARVIAERAAGIPADPARGAPETAPRTAGEPARAGAEPAARPAGEPTADPARDAERARARAKVEAARPINDAARAATAELARAEARIARGEPRPLPSRIQMRSLSGTIPPERALVVADDRRDLIRSETAGPSPHERYVTAHDALFNAAASGQTDAQLRDDVQRYKEVLRDINPAYEGASPAERKVLDAKFNASANAIVGSGKLNTPERLKKPGAMMWDKPLTGDAREAALHDNRVASRTANGRLEGFDPEFKTRVAEASARAEGRRAGEGRPGESRALVEREPTIREGRGGRGLVIGVGTVTVLAVGAGSGYYVMHPEDIPFFGSKARSKQNDKGGAAGANPATAPVTPTIALYNTEGQKADPRRLARVQVERALTVDSGRLSGVLATVTVPYDTAEYNRIAADVRRWNAKVDEEKGKPGEANALAELRAHQAALVVMREEERIRTAQADPSKRSIPSIFAGPNGQVSDAAVNAYVNRVLQQTGALDAPEASGRIINITQNGQPLDARQLAYDEVMNVLKQAQFPVDENAVKALLQGKTPGSDAEKAIVATAATDEAANNAMAAIAILRYEAKIRAEQPTHSRMRVSPPRAMAKFVDDSYQDAVKNYNAALDAEVAAAAAPAAPAPAAAAPAPAPAAAAPAPAAAAPAAAAPAPAPAAAAPAPAPAAAAPAPAAAAPAPAAAAPAPAAAAPAPAAAAPAPAAAAPAPAVRPPAGVAAGVVPEAPAAAAPAPATPAEPVTPAPAGATPPPAGAAPATPAEGAAAPAPVVAGATDAVTNDRNTMYKVVSDPRYAAALAIVQQTLGEGATDRDVKLALALILARESNIADVNSVRVGQPIVMPDEAKLRAGAEVIKAGIFANTTVEGDNRISYRREIQGSTIANIFVGVPVTAAPPASTDAGAGGDSLQVDAAAAGMTSRVDGAAVVADAGRTLTDAQRAAIIDGLPAGLVDTQGQVSSPRAPDVVPPTRPDLFY